MINKEFFDKKQWEVERVIKYSQNYDFDINCGNMIEEWYKNKKRFIDLFNGQTIWKSDALFASTLPKNDADRVFNDFIFKMARTFLDASDFLSFIDKNEAGFFDNVVTAPAPQYGITEGMRLSKSFKFFFSDEDDLRWAQDVYSRCVQKNKLEGYIYLSVDPVDYLTLSENNANWRSCHALDGEYRAGNLSYMLDKTTVIAYLANENKEILGALPNDIPWYSKKWRMLFSCQEEDKIVYFSKQYPFDNDILMRQAFTDFAELHHGIWDRPRIVGFREIVLKMDGEEIRERLPENAILGTNGRVFSSKEVIIEPKHAMNFNDLIYSSTYTPWAAISGEFDFNKDPREEMKIEVGANIICPYCGHNYIKQSDVFVCDKCRDMLDIIINYQEDED